MNPNSLILHIVAAEEWNAAVQHGAYWPDSATTEGFIHCSTAAQVLGPANEFYRGQAGLVLLVIDPARLDSDVVYEDLYQSGQAFPHIYGKLNADAVVSVVDFPAGSDGTFALPAAIAALRD